MMGVPLVNIGSLLVLIFHAALLVALRSALPFGSEGIVSVKWLSFAA